MMVKDTCFYSWNGISYTLYELNNLNSEDDFEKLKAVKFFVAYGRNYPFKEIFEAIRKVKIEPF